MVQQNGEQCWGLLQDQILISFSSSNLIFWALVTLEKSVFSSSFFTRLFLCGYTRSLCANFDIPIDYLRTAIVIITMRNGAIKVKIIRRNTLTLLELDFYRSYNYVSVLVLNKYYFFFFYCLR